MMVMMVMVMMPLTVIFDSLAAPAMRSRRVYCPEKPRSLHREACRDPCNCTARNVKLLP